MKPKRKSKDVEIDNDSSNMAVKEIKKKNMDEPEKIEADQEDKEDQMEEEEKKKDQEDQEDQKEEEKEEEEKDKEDKEDQEDQEEEKKEDQEEEEKEEEDQMEEEEEDQEEDEEEEEEEEPASPIFYKYNKNTYTVDTTNFLQRNFSNIESTSTMNICIYKCIQTGCTPYLVYLMVYDDITKTLIFPKYSISAGSEESEEELESNILDEFKRTLFDIYPPAVTVTEDEVDIYTEELFRGFFAHDNTDITMVYDATRIQVPLADDKEYYWVTPYEMFASKMVHGLSVDPKVLVEIASADGSLDKRFYHLKNVDTDTFVKDPYVLFLCKPSSSSTGILSSLESTFGFSSEYENVESREAEEEETVQILYPRTKHDKIGTYTFFSSMTNIKAATRFAVFVDIDGLSPLYLEPTDMDKLEHLYDPENAELSTAITFMNGSQQIWCIKSPFYFSEMKEIYTEVEPEEADAIGTDIQENGIVNEMVTSEE
jgi:hypothetical protein